MHAGPVLEIHACRSLVTAGLVDDLMGMITALLDALPPHHPVQYGVLFFLIDDDP